MNFTAILTYGLSACMTAITAAYYPLKIWFPLAVLLAAISTVVMQLNG